MKKHMRVLIANTLFGVCLTLSSAVSTTYAAEPGMPVNVNVDNFVRAETAAQFD
jgi:hypothetical protein